MRSWRTLIGASPLIAAIAVAVAVVDAGATTERGVAGVAEAPTPHVSAPAPAPAHLGPVAVSDVDPDVLAAAPRHATRGGTVTQTVELTVIGGDLVLETTSADIALERVDGSDRSWSGTLPPVRVVDARGTHEGWDVRWRVDVVEVDGKALRQRPVVVDPGAPVVVAGLAEGVEAGDPGRANHRGRTLFRALEGWGGGTYEAGGVVTVQLPASVDADHVTVRLALRLG